MSALVTEGLRFTRASVRLASLMEPLGCVVRMVADVRKDAPELDPELKAIEADLLTILEHCQAAMQVVSTKVDLL